MEESRNNRDKVSRNLFEWFQNAQRPQVTDISTPTAAEEKKPDNITDFNKWYNYDILNTDERNYMSQNATPQNQNQGKLLGINNFSE